MGEVEGSICEEAMTAVLVRDLSPETHRELKKRAAKNGRSVSAEIRATLDEAIRPADRMRVGTEIAAFAKKYAKELAEVDFEIVRDNAPARFVDFSGPEFDRPEFE